MIRGRIVIRNEIPTSISAYKDILFLGGILNMNSILFQLFTHFFSPTSTLFRLVDSSRLRSYNKTVFLVSTCFGWLIGYLFVVKCMENSLVWKSNVTTPIRNLAIDLWSKLKGF
uniref:hypothetical protein n=1 Tax=Drosera capensis TaxID=4366 RepID=UPI0024111AA8|nr:hypothetical protein P8577_pgp099 [Drosera capensis]WEQ03424.1 hypothetical protein [Drosera capensis]